MYGQKLLHLFKTLPKEQLDKLVTNDALLKAAVQSTVQAFDGEDAVVQDLLNQGGALE